MSFHKVELFEFKAHRKVSQNTEAAEEYKIFTLIGT